MKGILEFDLRDDQKEFETACNAGKYKDLIWDLDQYLRSEIKYNEKLSVDTINAFQHIRDKISQELLENNISIE
jgi:hypothetical protein